MVEDTMFSGESKNIEYKVSLPDKSEKYMKTIVAFANTQGGKLIVGVDDKTHQIVGVENDVLFQLMDGIANIFSQMGLVEAWGSGIKRILNAAEEYGLPKPRFQEFDNMFWVELFRNNSMMESEKKFGESSEKSRRKNGNEFITTVDFADTIQKTDNYYVIVTREALSALPYSVEEIYGIRTSGRYGTLKQSYHEFYRIYGTDTYEDEVSPDIIITEDSNSGYQFFEHICIENGLKCESMNGKSNVFHYLNKHKGEKILVIADGAAFGSEIDRVLQVIHGRKNVALYLPESFEWMIMDADILKNNTVRSILIFCSNQ